MNLLFTVLVTFFAGMGAGLGTGFAGMSAAAVISPMLITFLHMDPYMAVGIALSSDVQERFFARLLQNTDAATREAFFRTMEVIGKNLDEILLQFS